MYYDIQPVEWSAQTRIAQDRRQAAQRRLAKSVAQPQGGRLQSRLREYANVLFHQRDQQNARHLNEQRPASHAVR